MAQAQSTHLSPQGSGHGAPEVVHTHHIIEPTVYYRVFAALFVLFILTVLAAFFDISHLTNWQPANLVIALIIAVIKAVIIVLYFMHVKYGSRLTQIFAAAGLVWLSLLFIFAFADYFTRGWIPQAGSWVVPGH